MEARRWTPSLELRAGATDITEQQARTFFGVLVGTASANASDPEFIPAAWPIDVIEITRSGLSEQRYASLGELRASAGLSAATATVIKGCLRDWRGNL